MAPWFSSMLTVIAALVLVGSANLRRPGGRPGTGTGSSPDSSRPTFEANPLFAVYQGRHEFDGRFPDWSDAGLQKWIRRLHQLRDSAAAFPIDSSDAARGLEREYLLAVTDRDLFWHERADWPHRNPNWYTDQIDPNVYLTRPYAPLTERMRAFTRWARGLPRALRQMRANLQTPMPTAYADIGRGRIGGMVSFLQTDVPLAFDSVTDSVTRRDFASANSAAILALKEAEAWLATEQKRGTTSFALGPELFRDMLRSTERVDFSLDTLEARGRADLESNLAALRSACSEFARGATLRRCVERMQRPQAGARGRGRRAGAARHTGGVRPSRRYRLDSGRERALVRESPPVPALQLRLHRHPGPLREEHALHLLHRPAGSYLVSGRTGGLRPRGRRPPLYQRPRGVAGALSELPALEPGQVQVRPDLRRLCLCGGLGPLHRRDDAGRSGLGEGDPEVHIGQLSNALLRNARYLSAIGLHTKGMTVAESERMFRDQAFQDPGNARQQAARGTYDPAYLNYTMGKLMILKLREDWTRDRGGREAWKQFHDAFLSYGGPPIPLVRRAMLGSGSGPAL